jgi:hypothetical protein
VYEDRFAYIPVRLDFRWGQGTVRTLEGFEGVVDWFNSSLHPDGHLYQVQNTVRMGWGDEAGQEVPNSERGALVFSLPATHGITLQGPSGDVDEARRGPAAFVIHFLGFLFGRRCQFDGWFFDLRLSSRSHADCFLAPTDRAAELLTRAFDTWSRAPRRTRTVLTNALYMHNRAPCYEWSWERFIAEYQVFDALYSAASTLHGVKARRHADRFAALADRFGLWKDEPLFDSIASVRNDLFHEALWGGVMPGDAAPSEVYRAPMLLHFINQRLGLAVVGLSGPYIGSNWQSLQTYRLELDRNP